jgi:rfaE bifunctional protein nucleotidyltransferase chain/domain
MMRVATIGCFDLLHPGHIEFLEAARSLGDALTVGIPDDALYAQLKGFPPVMTDEERAEMLEELFLVEAAHILHSFDYAAWVSQIKPDVLALSVDHEAERFIEAAEWVVENGGTIVWINRSERCSTTEIVRRVGGIGR